MPTRKTPLATQEVYHVVNRGVGAIPIFKNAYDYRRFISAFQYYQHQNTPLPFSKLLKQPLAERGKLLSKLEGPKDFLAEIIAFCLMPNHYHFLLKQSIDNGILNFIRLTTNSYSRYFNTRYERKGGLFEGRFEAVRVETDEQLLHLNRYIHLNPYSSFLVKRVDDLLSYPYSSLPEYVGTESTAFYRKELILSHFKDRKSYQEFVINQADYQRNLEVIEHQLLEK